MIVEPIQSEGGDHHASPEFFRGLQALCRKHGSALIIDEVQTGGGSTGRWWCHEHFDLDGPPDIVTFSKKMLLGGYYLREEFVPKQAYRVFNTWMGDGARLALLGAVLEEVKRAGLLALAQRAGARLERGIAELQREHPQLLSAARGRGTFRAVDLPTPQKRDQLLKELKKRGVQAGACGTSAMRLRPALIFGERHADIFLDRFRDALKHL